MSNKYPKLIIVILLISLGFNFYLFDLSRRKTSDLLMSELRGFHYLSFGRVEAAENDKPGFTEEVRRDIQYYQLTSIPAYP